MWQSAWQFEPIPVAGIINLCIVYALGVGPLRIAYFQKPFPTLKAVSFAVSMAIFLLVIITPLHLVAEVYLVSAHMAQFMVLICLAAPLFMASLPAWLLQPILTYKYVQPIMRVLTRPLIAFVIYNLTFTLWHIPPIFRVFLYSELWHGALYISVFATTCLALFPVMSPLPEVFPKLAVGKRLGYLLAMLIAHFPLAGVVAFYPRPLYPFYQPQVFGLTRLQDQYTGSAIMAVSLLLTVLTGIAITFVQWLANTEDASHQPDTKHPDPTPEPVVDDPVPT
ncbi:MAG: cytochrome c oxidase assembly protein [Deinococcota bacterium]